MVPDDVTEIELKIELAKERLESVQEPRYEFIRIELHKQIKRLRAQLARKAKCAAKGKAK
jgi:hypothetical protein